MQARQTGAIWRNRPRVRSQIVRRVCEALEAQYGKPRLGNPTRPLDDLIFILISNRTSPHLAEQTYHRLKNNFPNWDNVLESSPSKLRALLKPAGLSRKKSQQIRSLLRKVKNDFGRCDLDALTQWDDDQIHEYLTQLSGVSDRNRAAQAHDELEALIPPSRRFAFHVDCIAHGRAICRSKPDCQRCLIRSHCEYFNAVK